MKMIINIVVVLLTSSGVFVMSGCQFHVLAKGPIGRVDFCTHCNTLNVHMSFVTLRLPAQGAAMLHSLLGEALKAKRPVKEETPMTYEALA